jgi:hypothetical protein
MSDNETARSRLYNLYNEYTIYHNAHMGLWGESPVVKECNDWFKFEIGKALAIVKADKFIEQADGFVTDRQRTYLVNADDFDAQC